MAVASGKMERGSLIFVFVTDQLVIIFDQFFYHSVKNMKTSSVPFMHKGNVPNS